MDVPFATTEVRLECSSADDEIAMMLDCFNSSDAEMFDLLDGDFADAVAMDPLPVHDMAVKSAVASEGQEALDIPVVASPDAQENVLSSLAFAPVESHVRLLKDSHDKMCSTKRPRQRSLTTASPPRCRQRHHDENYSTATNSNDSYAEMIHKLAVSMKRSEASRANVLRQKSFHQQQTQHSPDRSSSMPILHSPQLSDPRPAVTPTATTGTGVAPQICSTVRLSGFFSGHRSTLTSGLEHSRRQVQWFRSKGLMNRMNPL
uniref:Uncharacterized protein n=1 Tax=Odontella aurita TaxID=265563 RepID=A0A7S4N770_9STRA|mmetsp:Transcript_50210/g.151140  ORF Transcript_50210/g.151140 Transcript_50210/m.151140 type:complete len:261 (+) Transcript_50210:137-919(+)